MIMIVIRASGRDQVSPHQWMLFVSSAVARTEEDSGAPPPSALPRVAP